MASKVYFANFRTTYRENLPQKLARLVKKAGMLENIDFENKYTAINCTRRLESKCKRSNRRWSTNTNRFCKISI